MKNFVTCTGCGRYYRPTQRHREFGSLGPFCTRGCQVAEAFKQKRAARRNKRDKGTD